MKRWYFAASVGLALISPAGIFAQGTGATGGGNFGTVGGTGLSGGTGRGNTTGGLAGSVNTTLLGNQVDLNFNSVFGTNATLANTTADIFAAYRPSGSGSGSGIGNTGMGSFSGGGLSTGTGLGSGLGGTNRTGTGLGGGLGGGTGGLGGNTANRGGLGGGGLGAMGGGLGGGALGGLGGGANRMGGLGGNMMNLGGGNRGGTGGFLGGMGGFLGGGAGSFLGGGSNNQQTAAPPMGYVVNVNGQNANASPVSTGTVTASTEFTQRLLAAPGLQGTQNLKVSTRGLTAILEGQVTSDYAKQLADAMIRLEPGVYEVENKLQIVAPKQ